MVDRLLKALLWRLHDSPCTRSIVWRRAERLRGIWNWIWSHSPKSIFLGLWQGSQSRYFGTKDCVVCDMLWETGMVCCLRIARYISHSFSAPAAPCISHMLIYTATTKMKWRRSIRGSWRIQWLWRCIRHSSVLTWISCQWRRLAISPLLRLTWRILPPIICINGAYFLSKCVTRMARHSKWLSPGRKMVCIN